MNPTRRDINIIQCRVRATLADKAEKDRKKKSLCIEHKRHESPHCTAFIFCRTHSAPTVCEAKLKIHTRIHAEYLIALNTRNK